MTGRIIRLEEGHARINTGWRVAYFGNDLWAVYNRAGYGPLFDTMERAKSYYTRVVDRALRQKDRHMDCYQYGKVS